MNANVGRNLECNLNISSHHLDKDSSSLASKEGEGRRLGRGGEWKGGICRGIKKPNRKYTLLRQSVYIYIYYKDYSSKLVIANVVNCCISSHHLDKDNSLVL